MFVPLDDRPPCLQWPRLMAPIASAEMVTPPRDLLGGFTVPGNPSAIADWLRSRDWEAIDAVIVSLDMLVYGGLVASRVHQVEEGKALERLRVIEEIREAHPELPVYGFNIIMRLAPTADGTNDAWRGALERWAELAPQAETDAAAAEELTRLEARIPDGVLADYRSARTRNLAINRAAVGLVENGTIDRLILGQDDAKPQGVHVADREALLEKIDAGGTGDRVAVQPGADELGMLLLARVLSDRSGYTPSIRVVYSSEAGRKGVAPYEDRPLHETVSLQIAAAGGRETADESAELLFHVFASRQEEGAGKAFAERIAREVRDGRRVIVADIDTRGNIQGGSEEFTEALLETGVFPSLFGYASWNTAGNTIGTALPQGLLYFLSVRKGAREAHDSLGVPGTRNQAQFTFLLHRLINDYAYHGLVRPDINRVYAREQGVNPMRLDPLQTRHFEKTILSRVKPQAARFLYQFQLPVRLTELTLTLPWGRTFEAEIGVVVSELHETESRVRQP